MKEEDIQYHREVLAKKSLLRRMEGVSETLPDGALPVYDNGPRGVGSYVVGEEGENILYVTGERNILPLFKLSAEFYRAGVGLAKQETELLKHLLDAKIVRSTIPNTSRLSSLLVEMDIDQYDPVTVLTTPDVFEKVSSFFVSKSYLYQESTEILEGMTTAGVTVYGLSDMKHNGDHYIHYVKKGSIHMPERTPLTITEDIAHETIGMGLYEEGVITKRVRI